MKKKGEKCREYTIFVYSLGTIKLTKSIDKKQHYVQGWPYYKIQSFQPLKCIFGQIKTHP